MDPRLKKNRQTLLLQKRTFISDNELYEMMRSRHVYSVQTELSKQLDITLKALKQDEKMKLVGFRIQKTMFLKRMTLLQKRKLEVLNTATGGDCNNLPLTRVTTDKSSISETAAKRREFSHNVSNNENNSKTASGQYSNHVGMSLTQSETDETGKAELRTEINQPVSKLKHPQGKMKSTLNSEWMCSIQEKAPKSDFSVTTKAGNTPQSQAHSRRKSHGDIMFKSVSESGSSESIAEKKSQLLNERVNLHSEPAGRTEVINFNWRRRTEKTNFGLLSGYLDRNNRQSESGSVCATISEIDESCPRIDCDELSISSELRNLTLNEVGKNTNTEGNVLGRNSVHTTTVLNAPVRNKKSIDQKVLAGIPSTPLNELDSVMTSSTKDYTSCQEHGNTNTSSVINPTSKPITPTTTDTRNSTSSNTPDSSRHIGIMNTSSKHKPHLPPQITPYLERSRSLSFNKESTFLKSKGRQISSSLSGKLERTITMIFVEDPDDGSDNPPKSQFDFEAWLSYNKRRRGYTKIFNDEVSTVTLEDTSKETNKPVTIRGSKKSPKRNVRFYLSRKQTLGLHPDPKPLSFREKSKEWYLNFRQAKRNIKKPKVHQINQKPATSKTRVARVWGYAVLPEIGAQSDSYVLSGGGSEGNADQKLSDGTGSHIILRETTDQRLQRLKDHSKILQVKVHDFVCS